jgi:hypothetical protein
MERTGTNARGLLRMLKARGCEMSEGHLSNVLKKSRRCSLIKAVALNEITGVPIRNMVQWPPTQGEDDGADVRQGRTSGAAA